MNFQYWSPGARSLNHLAIGLAGFWDTPSVPGLYRKMRPTLRLDSGTRFPFEAPMGKRVPFQSSFRNAVSTRDATGKAYPVLEPNSGS